MKDIQNAEKKSTVEKMQPIQVLICPFPLAWRPGDCPKKSMIGLIRIYSGVEWRSDAIINWASDPWFIFIKSFFLSFDTEDYSTFDCWRKSGFAASSKSKFLGFFSWASWAILLLTTNFFRYEFILILIGSSLASSNTFSSSSMANSIETTSYFSPSLNELRLPDGERFLFCSVRRAPNTWL